MQIDIHKIAKLIEIVSKSDVSEINLKQGDEELKITREKAVVQAVSTVIPAPVAAPVVAPAPAPVAAPAPKPAPAPKAEPAAAPAAGGPAKALKSPLPGSITKILVTPGQAVKRGETVMMMEAMKMENEIKAEKDGVVAEIKVTVGQNVMAEEVLLTIA